MHLHLLRGWVTRSGEPFERWRAEAGLAPADTAALTRVDDGALCARAAAAVARLRGRGTAAEPVAVYRLGTRYVVDAPGEGWGHYRPMWTFDHRFRLRAQFGY